jgi:glycosyltransferase involved in cell wall biosynthesis
MIHTGPAGQHNEEQAYSGDKSRGYPGYWMHLLNADVIIDHSWSKHCYLLKMEGKLKAPILGVCHAPIDTMMTKPPPVEKPCITCISKDQAAHFTALFNRPARHCYNGVDLDFYRPLNVPRTDRFLFLARFSSIKGPDLAIEACLEAGVKLDMVGDTTITNEPQLVEHCRRLMAKGKLGQINIVGNQSRGSCVWWLSQAHCMLHPNQRFREPFGLAPVEAMACGTPVIAWDNGAMRETVGSDNGVGALVQSKEELVEQILAWKSPMDQSVRDRCREWASQFSIENMVSGYESAARLALDTGGW